MRAKIREVLELGEMEAGEFQRAINVNNSTYSSSMNRTASADSASAGSKAPGGKADMNLEGIMLEDNEVPVYESCECNPKKGACEDVPPEQSVPGLADFMAIKGPASGNTSSALYSSYVFFKKMHARDGKPKSKQCLGMEDARDSSEPYGNHKPGKETTQVLTQVHYIVKAGTKIGMDQFSKPRFA